MHMAIYLGFGVLTIFAFGCAYFITNATFRRLQLGQLTRRITLAVIAFSILLLWFPAFIIGGNFGGAAFAWVAEQVNFGAGYIIPIGIGFGYFVITEIGFLTVMGIMVALSLCVQLSRRQRL